MENLLNFFQQTTKFQDLCIFASYMPASLKKPPEECRYYAHGKLLLTGEYLVLDGAKALAIPTKFGQRLEASSFAGEEGKLIWESFDESGVNILSITFELEDFKVIEKRGEIPHYLLQDTLRSARKLRREFLQQKGNVKAASRLEFSLGWGLGSSSTLIRNIAAWAKVNAFDLFFSVLQGSGYDIACASATGPIVYQLNNGHPVWDEIEFHPPFANHIFFVYLGKKQNSQQAVRQYKDTKRDSELIHRISAITDQLIQTTDRAEFISLLQHHENILSAALKLKKVQDVLFKDFPGVVKSLGAWGGDFVMAVSNNPDYQTAEYFSLRGFKTIFPLTKILFSGEVGDKMHENFRAK